MANFKDSSIGNKLLKIEPTIGVLKHLKRRRCLARMRICHTRFSHSYLLLGEEQSQCVGCNTHSTVCRFLLKYDNFSQIRNKNMKQLF